MINNSVLPYLFTGALDIGAVECIRLDQSLAPTPKDNCGYEALTLIYKCGSPVLSGGHLFLLTVVSVLIL